MDLALILLALIWGWRGKSDGGGSRQPPQLPPGSEEPERSPGGQASTTPWPQALPSNLPPFPGPGWEYDEPPPRAVVQRAGQLVSQLWAKGKGAHRTEQTAGRWITYQAATVASGKRGVVAFREKARRLPAGGGSTARSSAPSGTRTVAPSGGERAMRELKRGDGIKPKRPDEDVRLAQGLLRIKQDGQFGGGTETAVKAFQRSRGVPETGRIDARTWALLFATREQRARA